MTSINDTPLQLTIHNPQQPPAPAAASFWSGETPGFKDILDILNPLQHIPIVSSLYQAATGDTPSSGSSIIGGGLFGGPIGLVASIFDTIIQNQSGTGIAGNALAAIQGNPIPALAQKDTGSAVAGTPPDHLSANQRFAYNAYIEAQKRTA